MLIDLSSWYKDSLAPKIEEIRKAIDNPNGEVEDDLLKDLLDKSYNLVLGGFSKKKQKEILESGDQ